MKYGVYAIVNGKVKMYCLALLTNEEFKKYEKVAETRTKAEARKIVNDLGGITLV